MLILSGFYYAAISPVDVKFSSVGTDYEGLIRDLQQKIVDLKLQLANCETKNAKLKVTVARGPETSDDSLVKTAKKILRENWRAPMQPGSVK